MGVALMPAAVRIQPQVVTTVSSEPGVMEIPITFAYDGHFRWPVSLVAPLVTTGTVACF
jgi:hypothetical protein